MDENPEVFKGTSFQDLMEEIHGHATSKRSQISNLMQKLSDMVTEPSHAAMMAPLFKDLMDVAVKNDEHPVKMATIMQRVMSAKASNAPNAMESFFSEEDKKALMQEARAAAEEDDEADNVLQKMESAIEEAQQTFEEDECQE